MYSVIVLVATHVGSFSLDPFTAKDAIWRPEVITHTAICLTFVDKYFYVSQYSMCLF